jgi:FkbM family methyltransferase
MSIKKKFVPLESLVSSEILHHVDACNLNGYRYTTSVRGKKLEWLCLSRRLLWMASGQEYIEPELLDWIDKIPKNEVMWDIGASNGIFSFYAAACGVKVISVEPDPMNYFLLAYNNYLNSKSFGIFLEGCYNLAISNKMTTGSIHMKQMELGGHEKILDKSVDVFGKSFESEYVHPVLKVSLDILMQDMGVHAPKYLKIDVDGSELEVLEGATVCLKNVQSIFIELTESFMDSFAISFFKSHGFGLNSKYQVQHYEGLYNCIFDKDPSQIL